MSKIVLIGGGNIGRGNTPYETKEIDEEIVKMTTKEHPNLLFVGLASSFSDYEIIGTSFSNIAKKHNITVQTCAEKQNLVQYLFYME